MPVICDSEWCRVVSEPNGYTVDTIRVAYDDLPVSLESRTATITLTDGASTLDLLLTQNVSTSSIAETNIAECASVSPSIFRDILNVKLPDDATGVAIYNISGSEVYNSSVSGAETIAIDGSNFSSGMYIVKVVTANGVPVTFKVVKR